MSARPGRVAKEYTVPFPRPRSLEIMATKEVFDLTNAIKMEIVGEQQSRFAAAQAAAAIAELSEDQTVSETDAIPEFKAKAGDGREVGIANLSAFASGPGIKSTARGAGDRRWWRWSSSAAPSSCCRLFQVPQYIMPKPSEIGLALIHGVPADPPHLGYTLVELVSGFAIGAIVGLVMAAVITQFPFVEKIVTPYILLLVTTPMLALVPLLILRFGFGYTPRIIAVALAAGPMVMINAATGFRRVDRAKIALARSYGAIDAADLLEDPRADGAADDPRRPDDRLDLRPADRRRRRDGRRRLRPRQPADLLFVDDPDAAVLRGGADPLDPGHPDLRAVLPDRQEVGELGGLTRSPRGAGNGVRRQQPSKTTKQG